MGEHISWEARVALDCPFHQGELLPRGLCGFCERVQEQIRSAIKRCAEAAGGYDIEAKEPTVAVPALKEARDG